MSAADILAPVLGPPPQRAAGTFQAPEREWGVALPEEYADFGSAYGDATISDFIFVCGPRTLQSYAARMGPRMERSPFVPGEVLPTKGGMLLWGNTVEGDQLFLVDRGDGRWTVAAFRRNWADWYESDLTLLDWLRQALTGQIATDWLPVWPRRHTLVPAQE
ncbi:hypothetical protein AB5J52_36570 [Streptomyces sp. R39]|uniref:SMI1/KNR4 family protein n=1 Tax=Streptomyces sp. R39 TaxID=3238631 RepID=A0AB39QYW0_9ACTN